MSTLGQRMKSRRKELKLTQADLAAMLGYKDKSTIAKIESGTNDITQSRAWEIANALQMPISYLMGWTDEKPPKPITETDRALLEAFHAAPEFVRRMVIYNLGLSQGGEKDGNGKV